MHITIFLSIKPKYCNILSAGFHSQRWGDFGLLEHWGLWSGLLHRDLDPWPHCLCMDPGCWPPLSQISYGWCQHWWTVPSHRWTGTSAIMYNVVNNDMLCIFRGLGQHQQVVWCVEIQPWYWPVGEDWWPEHTETLARSICGQLGCRCTILLV